VNGRYIARALTLLALLTTTLGFAVAGTAQGTDLPATSDGSTPSALMPGSQTSLEFAVPNPSGSAASLRVRATDVTQDDDGCVPSETQAGDVTCGAGGGELGRWLLLRMVRVGDGADQQLWAGSLDQLQAGVDLVDQVAGGDSVQLRLVVELSIDAPNETQSDAVTFTLQSTYTGVLPPTEGPTVSVAAAAGHGQDQPYLAATGSSLSVSALLLATALAATGALLVAASRWPSRRPVR
jgi:hypothetical protein